MQVMLLVLIAVAAATIEEESEITGWRGAPGWIIFVSGVSLITEGIMLLLRFLNPKCFNNSYGIFGGLVRELIHPRSLKLCRNFILAFRNLALKSYQTMQGRRKVISHL